MASYTEAPSLDLAAGREVLDRHLAEVLALRGTTLEDLAWRRAGPRCLLVPFHGTYHGSDDTYLLRLDFVTNHSWPPSAQFVDPETLDYRGVIDQHHLPRLQSPEANVHAAYTCPAHPAPQQLICCSATLEYYTTLHGGDNAKIWREGDTFLTTLDAIGRAMAAHYHGRFSTDGE
jgi:hypothetical protein